MESTKGKRGDTDRGNYSMRTPRRSSPRLGTRNSKPAANKKKSSNTSILDVFDRVSAGTEMEIVLIESDLTQVMLSWSTVKAQQGSCKVPRNVMRWRMRQFCSELDVELQSISVSEEYLPETEEMYTVPSLLAFTDHRTNVVTCVLIMSSNAREFREICRLLSIRLEDISLWGVLPEYEPSNDRGRPVRSPMRQSQTVKALRTRRHVPLTTQTAPRTEPTRSSRTRVDSPSKIREIAHFSDDDEESEESEESEEFSTPQQKADENSTCVDLSDLLENGFTSMYVDWLRTPGLDDDDTTHNYRAAQWIHDVVYSTQFMEFNKAVELDIVKRSVWFHALLASYRQQIAGGSDINPITTDITKHPAMAGIYLMGLPEVRQESKVELLKAISVTVLPTLYKNRGQQHASDATILDLTTQKAIDRVKFTRHAIKELWSTAYSRDRCRMDIQTAMKILGSTNVYSALSVLDQWVISDNAFEPKARADTMLPLHGLLSTLWSCIKAEQTASDIDIDSLFMLLCKISVSQQDEVGYDDNTVLDKEVLRQICQRLSGYQNDMQHHPEDEDSSGIKAQHGRVVEDLAKIHSRDLAELGERHLLAVTTATRKLHDDAREHQRQQAETSHDHAQAIDSLHQEHEEILKGHFKVQTQLSDELNARCEELARLKEELDQNNTTYNERYQELTESSTRIRTTLKAEAQTTKDGLDTNQSKQREHKNISKNAESQDERISVLQGELHRLALDHEVAMEKLNAVSLSEAEKVQEVSKKREAELRRSYTTDAAEKLAAEQLAAEKLATGLQSQINHLETQKTTAETATRDLLKVASETEQKLRSQLTGLAETYDKAQKDLNAATKHINDLTKAAAKNKEHLEKLTTEMNNPVGLIHPEAEMAKQIEDLTTKCTGYEQQLRVLQERYDSVYIERTGLSNDILDLKKLIAEKNNPVELNDPEADMAKKIEDLEMKCTDYEEKLSVLQNQLVTQKQKFDTDLKVSTDELEALADLNLEQEEKVRQLQEKYNSVFIDKTRLELNVQELKKALAKAKDRVPEAPAQPEEEKELEAQGVPKQAEQHSAELPDPRDDDEKSEQDKTEYLKTTVVQLMTGTAETSTTRALALLQNCIATLHVVCKAYDEDVGKDANFDVLRAAYIKAIGKPDFQQEAGLKEPLVYKGMSKQNVSWPGKSRQLQPLPMGFVVYLRTLGIPGIGERQNDATEDELGQVTTVVKELLDLIYRAAKIEGQSGMTLFLNIAAKDNPLSTALDRLQGLSVDASGKPL
jgi:hypothetical protein